MTTAYQHLIGTQGTVQARVARHMDADTLTVAVTVLDVKLSFGTIVYLITPVAGSGQAWARDVKFEKEITP